MLRNALLSCCLVVLALACGTTPLDGDPIPPDGTDGGAGGGAEFDAGSTGGGTGGDDAGSVGGGVGGGSASGGGGGSVGGGGGSAVGGGAGTGGGAATGGGAGTGGGGGGTAVDAGVTQPPPAFEAVFSSRPADDSRSLAIEDRLVALIDSAIPGSTIRVALFSFTRGPPSQALIRAAGRGVDVRVVVDGDADNGIGNEIATLKTGLGSTRVHVCDSPGTACVGSGIMHHKTFLFSALSDGSRNVVVQASHNLTTTQLTMHNNALIVRGDAALSASYLRTFDDLERDVEIPDYYRIDDGDLATRVYFFPRPTGGDTVESILGNITCDGTARVRVAMAFFTDARIEVARALAARATEGCDVRVVAGDDEIPLGTSVASTMTNAGVLVTRYPARTGGWSLHSKYLLIDAKYAGSAAHRRLVFTGSHNWTGPALTINDETLLRVEDDGVFAAYLADWAHVRASAVKP